MKVEKTNYSTNQAETVTSNTDSADEKLNVDRFVRMPARGSGNRVMSPVASFKKVAAGLGTAWLLSAQKAYGQVMCPPSYKVTLPDYQRVIWHPVPKEARNRFVFTFDRQNCAQSFAHISSPAILRSVLRTCQADYANIAGQLPAGSMSFCDNVWYTGECGETEYTLYPVFKGRAWCCVPT